MAGSVSAGIWSKLYYLYMAIALVVGLLVAGWCLYSLWRFRARPGDAAPDDVVRAGYIPRERGNVLGAYVMAGVIAAVMFGLAFSTLDAVNLIEHPPVDEPAIHFEVTGFQFGWQIKYTGEYTDESGALQTFTFTTVNDLRVPVDTAITADVTSRDVQHVFGIVEYRVQIYAVPGTSHPIWFKATETGEVPIRCLRNCGVGHDDMIKAGTLTVLTREQYDAFIASKAPKPAAATSAPASTSASALVESGQLVLDTTTLHGGDSVTLTVMNREASELVFGAGDVNAPLGSVTVPAGGEAVFTFKAPADGECPVWAKLPGADAPEATSAFEVVPR